MSSGDGWTTCALGHRYRGRFGAAGLLVVAPDAPDDVAQLPLHPAFGASWPALRARLP